MSDSPVTASVHFRFAELVLSPRQRLLSRNGAARSMPGGREERPPRRPNAPENRGKFNVALAIEAQGFCVLR